MKIKQILISSTIITILSLCLSGCGGSDSEDSVAITACTVPDNLSIYQTLASGDTITDDTTEAEVSIFQVSDGSTKVCMKSGIAYIIRS